MSIRRAFPIAALTLLAFSAIPLVYPDLLDAQGTDRIWGRVETSAGDVYEGFIRWDRNEGSWVDLLNGRKELSFDHYDVWNELVDQDENRRERSIEFFGIRLSWDDDEAQFPSSAESGIRFGHIQRMRVLDDDLVRLDLRSGERLEMHGGSTDLGRDIREFLVDDPERGEVELSWRDIYEIDFGPAPAGARPDGERLYGTVEDRFGSRYTGYICWDLDEILTTDILDGEENGRDREIPFERIAAIEPTWDGSLVTFIDGEEMELSGSNDVDDDNRGIQISDPGLGMVEVEWDEFASIRFHDPDSDTGYEDFDGGHRLWGTVVTESGDELTGWIRWDADEDYSWELLGGYWRDVAFDIEFGKIAVIERASSRSAEVTLLDGRTFELEDTNDVDSDNKGIFIQFDDTGEWVMVTWDDFREVRFEH